MKYLVALGFLGMASAFQPTDGNIQANVNACITANSAGDCCRADDGTFTDAVGVACESGVHISDWDTSQVTSMHSLFSFKSDFNQDISGWDVSSVTVFIQMFRNADSFDKNLSCWDISAGEFFIDMFQYATSMTHTLCWDLTNVPADKQEDMFEGADAGVSLDSTCTATGCDAGGAAGGDACAAAATPAEYIDAQCCDC